MSDTNARASISVEQRFRLGVIENLQASDFGDPIRERLHAAMVRSADTEVELSKAIREASELQQQRRWS